MNELICIRLIENNYHFSQQTMKKKCVFLLIAFDMVFFAKNKVF